MEAGGRRWWWWVAAAARDLDAGRPAALLYRGGGGGGGGGLDASRDGSADPFCSAVQKREREGGERREEGGASLFSPSVRWQALAPVLLGGKGTSVRRPREHPGRGFPMGSIPGRRFFGRSRLSMGFFAPVVVRSR